MGPGFVNVFQFLQSARNNEEGARKRGHHYFMNGAQHTRYSIPAKEDELKRRNYVFAVTNWACREICILH
jgi:hypothetical protein